MLFLEFGINHDHTTVDFILMRGFEYLEGTEAWKDALQKARLVLGQDINAPDPQGIFLRRGLRSPQRRMPTWHEVKAQLTRDQIFAGLILAICGTVVLILILRIVSIIT